jgi:hypothetical protein
MGERPLTSAAEGVAVDSKGVICGAEVGKMDIKKYVKEEAPREKGHTRY